MKKLWIAALAVFMCVGCRNATSPELRIQKGNALDSVKQSEGGEEVVKDLGNGATIVTGVPATTQGQNEPEAETSKEDKPGAVAVKMAY